MYKVTKNGIKKKSGLNRRQAVMYVSALVDGKKIKVIGAGSNITVSTECGIIFKIIEEEKQNGKTADKARINKRK